MTEPLANKPTPAAPVAPRRPHSFTTHGISVTDDYAWLKDARWQEVLRDPDQNGVELYRDRPQEEWPRAADGSLAMFTKRLDLEDLLRQRQA